ncbi:hypothetical protein F5Y17DRAFT_453899, partial [Xylariaceae sp. FL0594]
HTANDGSPIDAGNLQVVDADINAIKAFVTAYQNYGGTWNKFGAKQKVAFLSDVIDTFQYMQLGQATASYNYAYRALIAFWKIFSTVAAAAGYPQYDYVKAFTEVVNADLANQILVASAKFKDLLNDATILWNSNAVTLVYTASDVKEPRRVEGFRSKHRKLHQI